MHKKMFRTNVDGHFLYAIMYSWLVFRDDKNLYMWVLFEPIPMLTENTQIDRTWVWGSIYTCLTYPYFKLLRTLSFFDTLLLNL